MQENGLARVGSGSHKCYIEDMPNDENNNQKPADLGLIDYKLTQLMSTTTAGFGELKTYYQDLEKRVNVLEIWKAGEEAADKIRAAEAERQNRDSPKSQSSSKDQTDNFIKIIFIVLGLLGTALGLVGSGLFK